VRFQPVKLVRVSGEIAVISGLKVDAPVVSLAAQLLKEGVRVRTAPENGSSK